MVYEVQRAMFGVGPTRGPILTLPPSRCVISDKLISFSEPFDESVNGW